MKKGRHDSFPAELFRAEMDGVRMSADAKMRALSRMKGERAMFRRTGYALVAAMLLLMLTAGGTLALQNRDADQPDEDRLVLSDTSVVIPAQNGADAAVFTLTDALYDGESILIAYKLENGTQLKYDVPEDMLPEPMFPLEGLESGYDQARYRYMSDRLALLEKNNAVGYNWLQIPPGTVDGTSISSWYDWDAMTVDDMHYLWIRLRHEINREYANGLLEVNPDEQIPQENIWLNRDEITLQFSLCLEETALAIASDGQEMWFDNLTGASFELPPITIARTDEIQKRTVAEGVIQMDEMTYMIRENETCAPAVLRFDKLAYDGSNIDMDYYIAGVVRMPVITAEDVLFERMHKTEAWYLQAVLEGRMGDMDYRVYSLMLRTGKSTGKGSRFDVDPGDLRDENGNQLSGYMDYDGIGGTLFNPVTNMPCGYSYHLKLRVSNSQVIGAVPDQPLIDQESVTVYLPVTVRTVTYAEQEGAMYRRERTDETGVYLPLTLSRDKTDVTDANWYVDYIENADGGLTAYVKTEKDNVFGLYAFVYVRSPLTHPDAVSEGIWVYCTDSPERAYNAVSDIPVKPLRDAEDPYGFLACAAGFLNAKTGVRSVLLRFVAPGIPVLPDGTELDAYLDVRCLVSETAPQPYWVYTWKANADLSRFDGTDALKVHVPLMETKVYATLDEQGNVLVGAEYTPIGRDRPTLPVPLP